ncbi:DUF4158 domain-containing protein [Candidatus Tisiphia endosymbiont of Sialis lutaria]|uniref:DUF4158 domain-containing protein n=1 Tax=Candidatus Tisiphia endosymbiont of Sialis lutaria TaxID=2029164 RepID=UPI00312C7F3B
MSYFLQPKRVKYRITLVIVGSLLEVTTSPTSPELTIEWTLLPEEINFIKNCARGVENIVRYALQTCYLRLTGRFITSYSQVSLKICNYLTKQFNLDPFIKL